MGVARRFVKFGGALGGAQMAWLRDELAEAAGLGERVIVCCHLVQPCGGVWRKCGTVCRNRDCH